MENVHQLLQSQLKRCFGDTEQIPAELAMLLQCVNQAYVDFDATLVERERALEQKEREAGEATAAEREQRVVAESLRSTAFVLSNTLDLDEVLDHMLRAIGRVIPHETASVILLEEKQAHVARVLDQSGHRLAEGVLGRTFRLEEMPILVEMSRTHRPMIVADTQSDPKWRDDAESAWVRSYLGAPIEVDSQVVGFIRLNSAAVRSFTFLQAERLQAFASQAAIAVKIARLCGHAEKPAAMMERQRSAKDLHDLLSQTLWTASLMADALPELGAKDPAEAGRSLEKLLRLMHDAFAEMRTLLLERRPAMLVEVPLDDLLSQLTGAAIGRGIGAIAPSMEGRATSPPDLHTAVYRLPQEAFEEHDGGSTFPPSSKLTQREADVLELMVAGLSNAEIAQRLSISTYTVKNHVSGILVKMGVSNRTEAVSTVLRRQS